MASNFEKLFTIITPTYNRAHLITEALNSVKAQTYRPIELILVDDGSTDNTDEVVKAWARENEEKEQLRVEYIFQSNAGASAARNRGFEAANGEYIQFLDSDDRLHPERLARLAKAFMETDADFIQTGFEGFDPKSGKIVQTKYGREDEDLVSLALRGVLWANTLRAALSRELVQRIGTWRTDMICFEDREYMERAILAAEKGIAIKDILASAARDGENRVSDRNLTHDGRRCRILCEAQLAEAIRQRSDLSEADKTAFVSRLYRLGCRSNASGWTDLGRRCADLADAVDAKRSLYDYVKRFWARTGSIGGQAHRIITNLRRCNCD